MRPTRTVVSAALTAAALVGGGIAPSANAGDEWSINGTFAATSDGTYATTDYKFHTEDTVKSVWTITSTCTGEGAHCTGQVSSDQGWSAPIYSEGHVWYLDRDIPNWETCPDSDISFPGHQTFQFYPANANGVTQIGSGYLEGKDKTVGPRFACGTYWYGKPLVIVMQFRLDRIG